MLLSEPGKLSVTVLVLEVQACWKTSQIEKERQKKCCSVYENQRSLAGFFASDNLVKHGSYSNVLLWLSTYNFLIFMLLTLKFLAGSLIS